MSDGKLSFEILANTAKAMDGILDVTGALKGLAGAAIGAFAVKEIAGFFADATKAALEGDASIRRVNLALASTGDFSAEASKSVIEFTDALADSTGKSGEAVQSAFALAKSFNLTNEEAQKVTKAALDLSAVTGKDLDSSVKALAGTYNGVVGPLGKTDSALKGLSKTQLEAGIGVDILAKKYEGAAAAAADTFGGNLTRATEKMGDWGKEIGFAIIQNPIFQDAMRGAADAVGNFADWIKNNRDAIVEWTNKILGVSAIIASSFLEILTWVGEKMTALYKTFADVTGVIGRFIPAFKGLSAYFETVGGATEAVSDTTRDWTKSLDDFAVKAFTATKAVDESAKGIKNQEKATREALGATDDLKGSFKDLTKELEAINKENAKVTKSAEEIRKAEVDAANATADRATRELKAAGELTAANQKIIATFKLAAAEKARLAALPLGSFEKLKDDLSKVNEELLKQKGLSVEIADAEAERARQQAENARKELEGLGKLNDENLKMIEAYEKAIAKKRELANIEIAKANVEKGLNAPLQVAFEAAVPASFADTLAQAASKSQATMAANPGLAQGIGAGAGILGAALGGKQGAQKLISGAASMAADAFIPGLGQAVGPIVDALSQGPEAVKGMVTQFAEAFPEIIDNIAEAIPVLVETLAEKADVIAVALARSMPKVALALAIEVPKALVRGLGKSLNNVFSTALKAPLQFAPEKITQAFNNLFKPLGAMFSSEMANKIKAIGENMLKTYIGTWQKIANFAVELFRGVFNGISQIFSGIGQLLQPIFDGINNAVGAFTSLFSGLGGVFSGLLDGIKNGVGKLLDGMLGPVKTLANTFIDMLNALRLPKVDVGGKVLGKSFSFTLIPEVDLIPGNIKRFAKGGDIPAGFANDTFPAMLSSGEAVITDYTTRRLNAYLDKQESGESDTNKLLLLILAELQKGHTIDAAIQIGSEKLGKAVLGLKRTNKRTA